MCLECCNLCVAKRVAPKVRVGFCFFCVCTGTPLVQAALVQMLAAAVGADGACVLADAMRAGVLVGCGRAWG